MEKNKFSVLLIVSLVSLAIALCALYFIFDKNNQLQEKIILYGFVWSVFCFSFTVFFYGILNTIAEVKGSKFNIKFSIKGAGAFLAILLFGGLYFIFKTNEQINKSVTTGKDTIKTIKLLTNNHPNDTTSVLIPGNVKITGTHKGSATKTSTEVTGKAPELTNEFITSTISGRILLPNGNALVGATVISGEFQTKTDETGFFNFNIKHYKNVFELKIKCFKDGKEIKLVSNKIGTSEPLKDFNVIQD